MKSNVKMKALAVAVLGLAGFAFAGASMAVCPPAPGCPADPAAPAGPWTSKSVLGGEICITTGGFGTPATACKMEAAIINAGFGSAFVRDNTPAAETRYRAKFFVNVDNLTGLNSIQSVRLLSANTDTPFLSIAEAARISVVGNLTGTAKSLTVVAGCNGAPSNICTGSIPLTTTGVQAIQIDWVKSATGSLKVWLNNNTEASPNLTLTGNTDGWVVDFATLGLSNPSPNYRTVQINKIVSLDEFDSRRQTFIN